MGTRNLPITRLASRFTIATWSISTLMVLVCAYNGLLVFFVMASNAEPNVESLMDLAYKSNVLPVIGNRWASIWLVIILNGWQTHLKVYWAPLNAQSATSGIYKQFGDKLRLNPKSSMFETQRLRQFGEVGRTLRLSQCIQYSYWKHIYKWQQIKRSLRQRQTQWNTWNVGSNT